ncbi:MAG: malectin domain-containing carbohydrate-binding protein [Planctomycetota bacterium]
MPAAALELEGGNRVVALVIEDLLPAVEDELAVWQSDLTAEGYDPVIRTWPRAQTEIRDDNRDAIALWERICELEAEAPLHGVILVGRFPHPRWEVNGKHYDRTDEAFLHLDSFSPYIGNMDPEHWLSRVDALDRKGRELSIGHEGELIARYFRHLHRWRTGALRLPHQTVTAMTDEFDIDLYGPEDLGMEEPLPRHEVWGLYCTQVWPDYIFVGKNAANGLSDGGEYFMELSHGYKNGTSTQVHNLGFFHGQPCMFHFVVNGSCHVNGLGNMDSQSLFGRDSAVLWAGAGDIALGLNWREAIAEGLPVGRIILERDPDWQYSAHQYGDLTVRVTAHADNRLPSCTSATSDRSVVGQGEPVAIDVAGSDPDDTIGAIHVHPKGWYSGKSERLTANPGETFTVTYQRPHVYRPFALVEDSYGAFGWKQLSSIVVTPPGDQALRVNCGYWPGTDAGPGLTDPDDADLVAADGTLWLHDQWHAAGTYGRTGDSRDASEDATIAGTADPDLYRHCLQLRGDKPVSYRFPLDAGRYTVQVLAADLESTSAGTRLVDIAINDTTVAEALDVYVEAGGRRVAWQGDWSVEHAGGDLVVRLAANADSDKNPHIGAIAVIPGDAGPRRTITITVRDEASAVVPCVVSCDGIDVDIAADQPQASFGDLDPQGAAAISFLTDPKGIAWMAGGPLTPQLPLRLPR